MIQIRSILEIADNSGAKRASCIKVLKRSNSKIAHVGDIIKVHIKEALPESNVKQGEVADAVIVRTRHPIHRADGSHVRFNSNAVVLIDNQKNPRGTRIFGPVARELRDLEFTKIISLAPEVV